MARSFLLLCHPPVVRGGSMQASAQLVRALAGAGQRVSVVSPVVEGWSLDPADTGLPVSVGIKGFPMPAVGGVFLGYRDEANPTGMSHEEYTDLQMRRALPILEASVRHEPPDLIIIAHEVFTWQILERVKALGLPVAVIAHGPLAAIVNGQMQDRFVAPLLEVLRQADLVLPVAEYVTRFAVEAGLRARTLHNIVDTHRFAPTAGVSPVRDSLGIGCDEVVVLHASTMRPVKRVMDIVEAAAVALAKNPRLVYLMLGDSARSDALRRRCEALGIAGRMRFPGWVPQSRMDLYHNAADISVLSSVTEGMPFLALEALACGRTAVVSDLQWTREVVAGKQSMLTFPVGDIEAQADSIVRAAGDAALRTRLGAAGRDYVERYHTRERVLEAFNLAVDTLLG